MNNKRHYSPSKRQAREEAKRRQDADLEAQQQMAQAERDSADFAGQQVEIARDDFDLSQKIFNWTVTENILLMLIVAMTGATVLLGVFTLRAANQANETAKEAITIGNRPWISVTVEPASDFIWNEVGNGSLDVVQTLKVYGNLPATRVNAQTWLFAYKSEHLRPEREANTICDKGKSWLASGYVIDGMQGSYTSWPIIFPDAPLSVRTTGVVWAHRYVNEYGADARNMSLALIGCVFYSWPGEKDIHSTPVTFGLGIRDPETGQIDWDIGFQQRNISSDRLFFSHSFNNLRGPD